MIDYDYCFIIFDYFCMFIDVCKCVCYCLSIVCGYLESIVKMLDDKDVYCVDVLC